MLQIFSKIFEKICVGVAFAIHESSMLRVFLPNYMEINGMEMVLPR
jgi:hypothetical protein